MQDGVDVVPLFPALFDAVVCQRRRRVGRTVLPAADLHDDLPTGRLHSQNDRVFHRSGARWMFSAESLCLFVDLFV